MSLLRSGRFEDFGADEAVFGFEAAAAGVAVDGATDGAGEADPRFEAGEVVGEHLADQFRDERAGFGDDVVGGDGDFFSGDFDYEAAEAFVREKDV